MNIFKQLYFTLFSPKDIAQTSQQGIGKTILYVFLLSLISIIPSAYYFSTMAVQGVSSANKIFAEDMPDFTINNGKLSVEDGEPYTKSNEGFTIILDDTGSLTETDVKLQSKDGVALLQKKIVFIAGGDTLTSNYSLLEGMKVTKQDAKTILINMETALPITIPLVILAVFIFSSASMFIKISIFAVFGLFIKNAMQLPLGYRHVWRLTAYSVSLATIFFTIMSAFRTIVPYASFINWAVTFIMLYLSLKELAAKKENK